MSKLLLAIDVGGTKIEAVAADTQGVTLGHIVADTDSSGPEGLLDSVEDAIQQVLRRASAGLTDVAGVGIGVPGQVHPESGVVRLAVNLNLTSFPLAMALAGRLQAPVNVENDVRLAALGLYHRLHPVQAQHSLAYVSIGTGVAAGIVHDGRLLRGANGMAGEIGHIVIEPDGERCLCGLWGCLETIVSGPAIARQARVWSARSDSEDPASAALSSAGVYAAAAAGDERAKALVHHVSAHLARALHWLVMSYDVQQVIVGGGVSAAGDAFWRPIETELQKMRQASALAQSMLSPDKIILFAGDENPGIWGATILAQQAAGDVHPNS